MTKIVNKRIDSYDVYIGRGSPFGNRFVIGVHGTRDEVIDIYEKEFYVKVETDKEFKNQVLALKGKILGCFCKQKDREVRCHGDVILKYLENL